VQEIIWQKKKNNMLILMNRGYHPLEERGMILFIDFLAIVIVMPLEFAHNLLELLWD